MLSLGARALNTCKKTLPVVQYNYWAVNDNFFLFFSQGLCSHRTSSNQDQFKKPLFVAYFDVDYTKNPKGTNYWRNR